MTRILRRGCALLLALVLSVCLLGGVLPGASASELKTAIGTVKAGALYLRETPSTSGKILATAYRGDKAVVIQREGEWYKVVFNLKIGYMYGEYLELDEIKNIKIGYARFDYGSNVRGGPGTESSVVARAPRNETCFIVGFNRGWYKVSYNGRSGYVRSDLVTMLETPYENTGSPGNTYHENGSGGGGGGSGGAKLGSASMTAYEKAMMIFGTVHFSDHRLVYASPAEARAHMTDVTIRTWDLNARGEKYTRSWILTVHENIAPTVRAIFEEIYALPEKPPIHSLGGYRWESKSEHTVGLALDVNARENGYFSPSGQLLYGTGFDPAHNPYAIPVEGAIDRIFAKYGFKRGIYWHSGYKDYMHYSFFGT